MAIYEISSDQNFIIIFTKLMIIILGPIPTPNFEQSLLHSSNQMKTPKLIFYFDDCFGAHDLCKTQYEFLRDHFFPQFLWVQFKLFFSKLCLKMKKVKTLKEYHEIGGRIRIRPNKIEKL